MAEYNTKDIFLQRRTSTGTFEESPLAVVPNTVLVIDAGNNLTLVDTASFVAGTSSIQYAQSASIATLAISASYVVNTSDTASLALALNPGANIYLSQSFIIANTSSDAPSHRPGQMWWDKISHTYAIDTLESRLQIGQENYIRALAGEVIPNGYAVYINGSDIDPHDPTTKLPVVYLALADGTGTKTEVVGIATQTISTGAEGFITTQGIVNDVDTGTFFDGDTLYLSSTDSGSLVSTAPVAPYETVKLGINLYSHGSNGRVFVSPNVHPPFYAFVGPLDVPSISNTGSTVNIGQSNVYFCTTADGKGPVEHFTVPSASFTVVTPFLDVQYVVAQYNGGTPQYQVVTDLSTVDDIQTVAVSTFTLVASGNMSYVNWGNSGILLANKQNHRTIDLYGAQRASGLNLSVSASHVQLTSGTGYLGTKQITFSTASTEHTGQFQLIGHSASVWASFGAASGWINDRYDDGINLQTASAGKYIVNYVYRGIGSLNRCQIYLGNQYTDYADAVSSLVPTPPPESPNINILTGRIITQQGNTNSLLVESAFSTILSVAGITNHNQLVGLQGGTTNQYYHLSSASYARIQGSSLDTASYLAPGATLYVVSASAGLPSSYIEPYNIPVVPYDVPYKEGRMFYDKDYSNWVYYPDHNFRIHLGKEVIWRVHNPFTSSLAALTAVYLSGSTNGLDPDVYPALADGSGLTYKSVGVLRHTLPSGSTGYVLQIGVAHNVDMSGFEIGDEVWLSNTVPGGFLGYDPGQPYESVLIGYCQVNGADGSLIVHTTVFPPPSNAYAGMTTAPIITNNNNGTITLSTGSVNLFNIPSGEGNVTNYPLEEKTFTVTTGSTNYIIGEHSASAASYGITTNAAYANGTSIIRVAMIDAREKTPGDWDVHQMKIGIVGLALANRLNNRDIILHNYQRESGLTLYVTGSEGDFGLSEGKVWYGPNQHSLSAWRSFNAVFDDTYQYVKSASVWTLTEPVGYQNTRYNGPSGLANMAPNSCSAVFVYKIIDNTPNGGTKNDTAIVYAEQQYATLIDTINNVQPPADLPQIIANMGTLTGFIAFQSGSYVNVSVQSAYTTLFAPATVTQHNNLLGIQGGVGGEYYHMGFDDYTGTGTGVMVRKTNATMSNPMFEAATPGHIPYWSNGKTLTRTGSIQVVGDEHVLINSASFPDATNPEALLVYQVHTESVNNIGAYATVNNYCQIYNQNLSSASLASTDFCATNDTGSQDTFFIDMGIAGSGYNNPLWPWVKANDGYLEMDHGDLWLATLTDNKLLFAFNNTASTSYADKTGFYLSGSFFGSLFGSSSWATSAKTASYSEGDFMVSSGSSYAILRINGRVGGQNVALTSTPAGLNINNSISITGNISSVGDVSSIGDIYATNFFGTASLATEAVNAITASSLVSTNDYAVSNLTASSLRLTSPYSNALQVGTSLPLYLSQGWPTVAFNAYYNNGLSSWVYGPGSSNNWSAFENLNVTSGQIEFHLPTVAGNAGATWDPELVLAISKDGTIKLPRLPSGILVIPSGSTSVTSSSDLTPFNTTASLALTASHALGMPAIKSGVVPESFFNGSPRSASVVFTTPFANASYSITVTGQDARMWTIQDVVSGSFTINSNSDVALVGPVYWQAMRFGEFYSNDVNLS